MLVYILVYISLNGQVKPMGLNFDTLQECQEMADYDNKKAKFGRTKCVAFKEVK